MIAYIVGMLTFVGLLWLGCWIFDLSPSLAEVVVILFASSVADGFADGWRGTR